MKIRIIMAIPVRAKQVMMIGSPQGQMVEALGLSGISPVGGMRAGQPGSGRSAPRHLTSISNSSMVTMVAVPPERGKECWLRKMMSGSKPGHGDSDQPYT